MPDWRQFVREHLPPLNLGGAREAEIVDELAQQLEDRYEDLLVQGASESEARARAAAQFPEWARLAAEIRTARRPITGRMPEPLRRELHREDPPLWMRQGRGRIMGDFLLDIRYALRTAAKQPGFTAVVLLTLAVGIGANTAIFSVLHAVVLNPLPYRDAERLVSLAATNRDTLNPTNVSFGESREWAARSRSFEAIALYRGWGPTLTGGGQSQVLSGMRVSHNFFSVLGVRPAAGRDFRAEEDQPERWRVLLLSYGFWKRQFGGEAGIVGRVIHFNERPYEVVGILPENFQPLLFRGDTAVPDVWAPLGYAASDPFACRSCWHLQAVARLKPGVTLSQARQELSVVAAQVAKQFPQDIPADQSAIILPLAEKMTGNIRGILWLLLSATGFVLLIACANVANLILARSAVRRREMAIRLAVGAARMRIIRQLLTESALLSLVGGAAGILLAGWGMKAIVRVAPAGVPRLDEVRVDPWVLGFALVASALTALVTGLVPALQTARMDQREILQEGSRSSSTRKQRRLRNLLVISEISLAFMLMVGSGLLLRSLVRALSVDPGLVVENLHTVNYGLVGQRYAENEPVVRFHRTALERIRALPSVKAAAIVTTLPLGGSFDRRGFHIQDRVLASSAEAPSVDGYYVSYDYFAAMGIPLKRGRLFQATDEDPSAPPVALISESTAREMWPGEDPVGKKAIQLGGRNEKAPWATIVGIVGDVRQYGLDSPPTPQAYVLHTHEPFNFATLVVRSSSDAGSLRRSVEREIWALDKSVPIYGPATMSELLSASLAQRRFTLGLLGGFGALSLLLAVIGIHGVMAYSVSQRASEFGIRMALGARPVDALKLVLQQGMALVIVGITVGVAGALTLSRTMENLLFQVRPTDPATLAGVALLLGMVALLACWLPARRAARVDPLVALRHE